MSVTKIGFSARKIQRQLELKRYEPVWALVYKIRKAMGNLDARYTLEGLIEFVYKLNKKYFSDRLFESLVISNITEL